MNRHVQPASLYGRACLLRFGSIETITQRIQFSGVGADSAILAIAGAMAQYILGMAFRQPCASMPIRLPASASFAIPFHGPCPLSLAPSTRSTREAYT